ncbi:MAG: hypothetical protein DI603_21160 [Roseateles depolymerans]|uniref:Nucleotidyltransferase n=1 Tax=Roseateles depolymerans TaxID=76731 RepID=A0A2W5FDD6_9BURK|nr:MAG: hypothetical protein DI603_21160 [Roseateles depolymerans]
MRDDIAAEIANAAARLIVDEGLDWGAAKQRAARDLGLPRAALPGNDQVEDAVREYIAIFHADTQPEELRALRELAARWMARLAEFRPHLTGAVWRGTATRLSNIHLQLFCDDPKSAEIALVNQGLDFDVAEGAGPRGRHGKPADWLLLDIPCPALQERVTLCLTVLDFDDLRGALKPDARGRTERGDLDALQQLLDTDA